MAAKMFGDNEGGGKGQAARVQLRQPPERASVQHEAISARAYYAHGVTQRTNPL
jgi:hypothetical protein